MYSMACTQRKAQIRSPFCPVSVYSQYVVMVNLAGWCSSHQRQPVDHAGEGCEAAQCALGVQEAKFRGMMDAFECSRLDTGT